MSNMSGLPQPISYKDVLTLTNNYQGLGESLTQVQDAAGNSSPMQIALEAVNFSRSGDNTFQLDGIPLTASATNINNICGSASSRFPGAVFFNRTAVTTPTYTALASDYLIAVTVNAAGVTIDLPTPSVENAGQFYVVQDEVGNAGSGANDIDVRAVGGSLINGVGAVFIGEDYGQVTLYSNGTNYFAAFS